MAFASKGCSARARERQPWPGPANTQACPTERPRVTIPVDGGVGGGGGGEVEAVVPVEDVVEVAYHPPTTSQCLHPPGRSDALRKSRDARSCTSSCARRLAAARRAAAWARCHGNCLNSATRSGGPRKRRGSSPNFCHRSPARSAARRHPLLTAITVRSSAAGSASSRTAASRSAFSQTLPHTC